MRPTERPQSFMRSCTPRHGPTISRPRNIITHVTTRIVQPRGRTSATSIAISTPIGISRTSSFRRMGRRCWFRPSGFSDPAQIDDCCASGSFWRVGRRAVLWLGFFILWVTRISRSTRSAGSRNRVQMATRRQRELVIPATGETVVLHAYCDRIFGGYISPYGAVFDADDKDGLAKISVNEAAAKVADPQAWIEKSADLAKQYAYAPPVSLGKNAVLLTHDYEIERSQHCSQSSRTGRCAACEPHQQCHSQRFAASNTSPTAWPVSLSIDTWRLKGALGAGRTSPRRKRTPL